MDGLVTIIIFFIISSLFSGKKNQKKKSRRNINNDIDNDMNNEKTDVLRKVQQTSNKSLLGEIRSAREKMLVETENMKKTTPSQNFEKITQSLNKELIEKEQVKKNLTNKNKSLIPSDYISQEGFSSNTDYIYSQDIEQAEEINKIKVYQPKKLFENKTDLKRAMILKEVLDKPLSLRAGR